jgi:hypothetical protein
MHRHLIPKFVGAVVLLTALGGGAAYAFTAGNVMPASYAGQGTATVSGYTVSNMNYGSCSSDADPCLTYLAPTGEGSPQDRINSVSFQLSPDNATFVAVDVWDTTGTILLGGGHNSCTWSSTGPGYGTWNPLYGVWTCDNLNDTGQTITPTNIGFVDVEAVQ